MTKKVLGTLLLFSVMLSCGSNEEDTTAAERDSTEAAAAAPISGDTAHPSGDADVAAPAPQLGKELISKSDCATCHKEDGKLVGPAFNAIARRYAGDGKAPEKLAEKIIQGGAGNWGQTPMPEHLQLSKEDASAMVTYILQLK